MLGALAFGPFSKKKRGAREQKGQHGTDQSKEAERKEARTSRGRKEGEKTGTGPGQPT
jgi:hypothetical protein